MKQFIENVHYESCNGNRAIDSGQIVPNEATFLFYTYTHLNGVFVRFFCIFRYCSTRSALGLYLGLSQLYFKLLALLLPKAEDLCKSHSKLSLTTPFLFHVVQLISSDTNCLANFFSFFASYVMTYNGSPRAQKWHPAWIFSPPVRHEMV